MSLPPPSKEPELSAMEHATSVGEEIEALDERDIAVSSDVPSKIESAPIDGAPLHAAMPPGADADWDDYAAAGGGDAPPSNEPGRLAAVSAEAAALRRARANLTRGIAEDTLPPAARPGPDPHSDVLVQAIQAMRIISIGDPTPVAVRPTTPATSSPRYPSSVPARPLAADLREVPRPAPPIDPTPLMPTVVPDLPDEDIAPDSVPGLDELPNPPVAAEVAAENEQPLPPVMLRDALALDVDLDDEDLGVAAATEVVSEPPEVRISEIPPEVDPADLELSEPSPRAPPASGPLVRPVAVPRPAPAAVAVRRSPIPPTMVVTSGASVPVSAQVAHAAAPDLSSPAPVSALSAGPVSEPMVPMEPPTRPRTRAWWEQVFGDDLQRTMISLTDRQLSAEVSFIEDSLGVERGAVLLDLACGTGRHAVELALRGYSVVGYDLSVAMLARAADEAQERKAKLNFLQGDMRELGFEEMFDGIFSWSTSFGFFDEEKNAALVHRIHRALRPGGMFLLDVLNRDFVTQRQPSLVWFEGDSCVCMDETRIDYITSRLKVKRTVMLEDGRTREIEYSVRLYSLHELGRMLHDAGFKVTEVSGHPATPGVFFGADSPRLIVLAEKS